MALDLVSFTPSTTISSSDTNSNNSAIQNAINSIRPTLYVQRIGNLTTGSDIFPPIPLPQTLTATSVLLSVGTAPDGSEIIVDILKNGTTIFSTKPQIADGATSGGGSAVFSTTSFSLNDVIKYNIDQVGSTTPGADLTIGLVFKL